MPVLWWTAGPEGMHSKSRGMGQDAVLVVYHCLSQRGFCPEAVLLCPALSGHGGSDLTLQLDASLHFAPTLHCSHQLVIRDMTQNLFRSCVHVLPLLLSGGPHLLLMHLQLFLDEAADLVEGGSPCGLQAPACLHDAVPAGPDRDKVLARCCWKVCNPRLFPAALCMSGTQY